MRAAIGSRGWLAALVAVGALLAPAGTAGAADEIVYSCDEDICTINPDAPSSTPNLTQTPGYALERYPVWSPDLERIAYQGIYGTVPSGPEIYTIPPTGGTATNVSNTTDRSEGTNLEWSPDSNFLVYDTNYNSSAANRSFDVNIARGDGTTLTPTEIGPTSNPEEHPTWSPDGQKVAYNSAGALYIANADGLSTPTYVAAGLAPDWSPDGTRLAYVNSASGTYSVRVISTAGGTPVPLGSGPQIISEALWSPDSTRVAWVHGNQTIYVRASDGSSPAVPIPTPGAGAPQNLAWSPDGTRLAFDAYTPAVDYQQIYVAKADGSANATAITSGAMTNVHPSWKPVPVSQPPGPPGPPAPPTPTPENPGAGTRVPATLNLSSLRGGGGPINPYRLNVFVNCYVQGYPLSDHPACKAFGQGKGGARVGTGLPRVTFGEAKGKAKPVVVLSAKATIPGGKTGKLKFSVTKKGRKIFKPGKVVRAKLTIRVTQPGNETVKKTVTLKLKAPKKGR